jgi:hypothetical protein
MKSLRMKKGGDGVTKEALMWGVVFALVITPEFP